MMSSPWAVALFVVAAAFSLGASAVLVVRLERLGARLGLSEALLGLVAALAADTPEVTSAVTALAHGHMMSAPAWFWALTCSTWRL